MTRSALDLYAPSPDLRAHRLLVIASCLWLTREPASIAALVRQYLREVAR